MRNFPLALVLFGLLPPLSGCPDETPDPSGLDRVHHVAGRCFALGTVQDEAASEWLAPVGAGDAFAFDPRPLGQASRFFLKASRLGTYLLYDAEREYLVSDAGALDRRATLQSDVLLIDDTFESPAEWELLSDGPQIRTGFYARQRRSGRWLGTDGLVDDFGDAAELELRMVAGCTEFPELTLDAQGRADVRRFDDGDLFGIVDTHSHILSNFAFGGGGLFHGAPFHPLGVEHALHDCDVYHGEDGRKDLFGFGFDNPGDVETLLVTLLGGQTPGPNHATAGWPAFTDWPSAPFSSTHQTQYYKWLERAYLAGLRLVVQHATSNQIICDLITSINAQEVRYACNDMVAVDRILDETYNMQDYIDAQEGGPGKGWFRIVTTPEDARKEIARGNMAVILGIETSNLFDCFLTPLPGFPQCTEQLVLDKLDDYHARGVRAMFPVHKYDNQFSAGDGDKAIIELGNFIQTGHFGNFTTDCDFSIPTTFDRGAIAFPGINAPRENFLAPAPNDFTNFPVASFLLLLPFVDAILNTPPTGEEVCQNHGLTPLGEFLIEQMMQRGMIIEVDHLPRRSYKRAYEMLEENDYPAAGTHGLNNNGKIYELGGVSKSGFGRCHDPNVPGTTDNGYQNRIQQIRDAGGYPAEGFGFDLNGFAGGRGPRFGPRGCSSPQQNPIAYPFTSYAGDVTFTQPWLGDRMADFNTEGFAHIGLLPELIQDVRADGVTDEELEPLFRSAEGYLRMWEKAVARGEALSAP